jgi:hypothetical protein
MKEGRQGGEERKEGRKVKEGRKAKEGRRRTSCQVVARAASLVSNRSKESASALMVLTH